MVTSWGIVLKPRNAAQCGENWNIVSTKLIQEEFIELLWYTGLNIMETTMTMKLPQLLRSL